MQLTTAPDATAVARLAADDLARVVRSTPEAVLVLPAGNTPKPLFAELARRQAAGELDLGRAHVIQLDELVGVAPGDARSFHAFLREHLLDPLGRDGTRDHLLRGDAPDPEAEIARHRAAVDALGTPDLVVLGLGLNGHIAFNEPGTQATDGARLLPLAEKTLQGLRKQFEPADLPTTGITLGPRELLRGRACRILVTGASKATILARLLTSPPTPDLPASLLGDHADCFVLADEAAASAHVLRGSAAGHPTLAPGEDP